MEKQINEYPSLFNVAINSQESRPVISHSLSLSPDHLKDLKKSRLTDETIREARIYSVPPRDISKIFNHPKVESMLAFPYPGTDHIRYKLFSGEPILDKDGHEIKYYQHKGSANRLYIPERVGAIPSDPSIPLHITEGEKKTLKGNQEGLYCIGLGGLWNFKNKGEDGLIPDFDKINFKGRTVYLVPDNDFEQPDRHGERKNLKQAVYELAYRLIDRGARVFIIELPQGPEKGLDDYLCHHSIDEFNALPKREIRKQTIEEMIEQGTLETLPEILKRLSNLKETERAIHVNALAKKLKVRKSEIEKDLSKLTRHEAPDIEKLLESGANPQSNFSAQNFVDGVLSFGAILGKERALVQSDGQIILADGSSGDSFRFKRSTLTAEAIKRFRAGEDVDGRELLNRIQTLFSDHVFFKDHRIPLLFAIWVIGTYMFKCFRFFGYLWINSFVKRCGKSLLLDIFSHLCFNATSRLVDPSSSFLFREADRNDGTLILDEIESLGGADKDQKSELISLLNAGFQRGSQAPRMESKNREFVVTYFNAYCPKALAGIKAVVDTIEDRAFKIPMVRKTKSEVVKRFNLRALDSHIEKIREDCFIFALRYASDVSEVYDEMTELKGTENLDDRLKDILEPLLSIASVIDAQADDKTMYTVKTLTDLARDMGRGREDQESLNGSIPAVVSLMQAIIDGVEEGFIPTDDLFTKFRADEDLNFIESKRSLAFYLAKLGLHRAPPKKIDGKTMRGYSITRKWLDDLGKRYA